MQFYVQRSGLINDTLLTKTEDTNGDERFPNCAMRWAINFFNWNGFCFPIKIFNLATKYRSLLDWLLNGMNCQDVG